MHLLRWCFEILLNFSTDTFTVRSSSQSGQNSPPTICGTNTNEHSELSLFLSFYINDYEDICKPSNITWFSFEITVYADMNDDDCNSLDFALGTTGIDATIPTRTFNIKVFIYCAFQILNMIRLWYMCLALQFYATKIIGNTN